MSSRGAWLRRREMPCLGAYDAYGRTTAEVRISFACRAGGGFSQGGVLKVMCDHLTSIGSIKINISLYYVITILSDREGGKKL